MAGAARFLINILFYGALDVNHWLPVGTTTTGTSIFTVAKVFEYQVRKYLEPTYVATGVRHTAVAILP